MSRCFHRRDGLKVESSTEHKDDAERRVEELDKSEVWKMLRGREKNHRDGLESEESESMRLMDGIYILL